MSPVSFAKMIEHNTRNTDMKPEKMTATSNSRFGKMAL
jgi:hypothetical protein